MTDIEPFLSDRKAEQESLGPGAAHREASGLQLLWMTEEPGDLGLPRPIESTLGVWFQREIEQMVESEQRRMHEIVLQLGKMRERRRKSTGA
ncbi:hypothetical protein [Sorangium sp. So ce128]|uniref:hypothetical protein n=1 Tax=Sorangium sp. So ce128 TaxID=3133281 RepID=UPI003F62E5DA